MAEPIRVLLVDDQSLIRMGFRMALACEPGIEIVGEASDGAIALKQVRALAPDVVLMDIRMPAMDGITATGHITRDHPGVRVLLLTTFDLDEYAFNGLRAGASGFLLKDVSTEELAAAIRSLARGDAIVSPRVTRRLIEEYGSLEERVGPDPGSEPSVSDGDLFPELTSRELECLRLIAHGFSNQEIADDLCISPTTVKTHVSSLLSKLGLRDRVQAVVLAYETGLLTPGQQN